jgi:hypothetical protein
LLPASAGLASCGDSTTPKHVFNFPSVRKLLDSFDERRSLNTPSRVSPFAAHLHDGSLMPPPDFPHNSTDDPLKSVATLQNFGFRVLPYPRNSLKNKSHPNGPWFALRVATPVSVRRFSNNHFEVTG